MDKDTQDLLAWYVNGTLAGPDRDRVEAALREDGGASALLDWERTVQAAVKSDPAFDVAADRGLFQTMQRIRADAPPKPTPVRVPDAGLFARLRQAFQWSPALAMACGVVAIQFAVIGQMWLAKAEQADYSGERSVAARPQASAAFIRVAFKPESIEGDLSTLLRSLHAEIVAGPSQLGDYYLLLDKQAVQDALAALQQNTHVESAEIVDALPARP